MLRPLAVLLAVCLWPSAAAQVLWGGVVSGATPAEVAAALPDAEPARVERLTLVPEDVLVLRDHVVCLVRVHVVFYFAEAADGARRLTETQLVLKEGEDVGPRGADRIFDCLADALTYKHGRPLRLAPAPDDPEDVRSGVWMDGETDIRVAVSPTDGTPRGLESVRLASVSVRYGTRVHQEAGRL